MPLQTSGTISLNDIHVEAGGASGSQASINDADIRALIGKASGAQMAFSEWYGASANWTTTITIGSFTIIKSSIYGYNGVAPLYGSLSDTTINTYGNRTLRSASWTGTLFSLNIVNAPNSGWTRIIVHNTSFYRSQGNFSQTSGVSNWNWSATTNPFAATSGTRTITFVI